MGIPIIIVLLLVVIGLLVALINRSPPTDDERAWDELGKQVREDRLKRWRRERRLKGEVGQPFPTDEDQGQDQP
jgi:hypothetical protein